jgi:pyruvate formate lyase activating enzyme
MAHLPPTPISTLEKAYKIGTKAGLKFIYLGNVPGNSHENTICYSCGRVAIERTGYSTRIAGLKGSSCAYCGADLNIRSALRSGVKK